MANIASGDEDVVVQEHENVACGGRGWGGGQKVYGERGLERADCWVETDCCIELFSRAFVFFGILYERGEKNGYCYSYPVLDTA